MVVVLGGGCSSWLLCRKVVMMLIFLGVICSVVLVLMVWVMVLVWLSD